ncbi:hypothetical protein BJ165DRAFT_1521856 [Panaeolus papilionaceus]|nr:hypothetical protein BJ165DRAFT_1521856 [Panaeolus papilionaceus]
MTGQSGTAKLNAYLTKNNQEGSLSWLESWTGPPDAKEWTCICKINGVEYERGVSRRKWVAKNIAAEATWAILTGASEGGST